METLDELRSWNMRGMALTNWLNAIGVLAGVGLVGWIVYQGWKMAG